MTAPSTKNGGYQSDLRRLAAASARQTFWHGNPCKICGETLRYVIGGKCHACARIAQETFNEQVRSSGEYETIKPWIKRALPPPPLPVSTDPDSIVAPPTRDRLMARR